MLTTTLEGVRDVRFGEGADLAIGRPTQALVRVSASCICGSDLWHFRGENPIRTGPIGHEAIGVIEEVGTEVRSFKPGDFVIIPFCHCDNTCPHCAHGVQSACVNGGFTTTGQSEFVVVEQAEGSLVAVPGTPDRALWPALLTLSDVLPTGWHAAVAAQVEPGATVVVVGDGAVGLCGVLAARQMGAERIVALSRHAPRQAVARTFGATTILAERGESAVEAIMELTGGVGADSVLECVGTAEAVSTAFQVARPGSTIGFVGVPHGVEVPVTTMFGKNIGLAGGIAPVRRYLPNLLELTLSGALDAAAVFDLHLPLSKVAEGYAAMDERRAIKVLLEPGT